MKGSGDIELAESTASRAEVDALRADLEQTKLDMAAISWRVTNPQYRVENDASSRARRNLVTGDGPSRHNRSGDGTGTSL